jgi:hypothetical protein
MIRDCSFNDNSWLTSKVSDSGAARTYILARAPVETPTLHQTNTNYIVSQVKRRLICYVRCNNLQYIA